VPVPRSGYAALAASLPAVPLTPVPGNNLKPADKLSLARGSTLAAGASANVNKRWHAMIATQSLSFVWYIRRRSTASRVVFATQAAGAATPSVAGSRTLKRAAAVAGSAGAAASTRTRSRATRGAARAAADGDASGGSGSKKK
jgi:hypothetical protein